jgi:hypothetical protein
MDDIPREITPIPVGTRVFDSRHPELVGAIEGWEMHSHGVLSAIPYKVRWDNEDLARSLRGMFYYWGAEDNTVPLSQGICSMTGGAR